MKGVGSQAPAVVMKAETIRLAGQGLETADGFLVDIDVEEAPLGSYGDVVVTAIGTDGGGQNVRLVGEPGTALDTTLGRAHGAPTRCGPASAPPGADSR